MQSDPLYWLKNLVITAREENDDDKNDNQNDASDDGSDDGEEGEDQGEDSGSDSDKDDDDEENLDKLKEALKKERRLRREKERELRRAKRGTKAPAQEESSGDDDGEPKQDDKLRRKLESEQQRTRRLAEGFRKREIDAAIERAARKAGFIDPTDALTDDIRAEIDYEQDKDDPSQIEVDLDSVEDAVKDLADRKKHLVGKAGPENKSGGKFRRKPGSEDDSGKQMSALQEHYPSLR